jgi:hypothetical protein
VSKCEKNAISILEKIDKNKIYKVKKFLEQYGDVVHVPASFMETIDEILATKILESTQQGQCIVLNPFLEDLMECQLFRLREHGCEYLIPLWHDELVYDVSGADMIVHCVPILDECVEIDEKNNIHIWKQYILKDMWERGVIEFDVGSKTMVVPISQLKMEADQIYVLHEAGIPRPNMHDIYNVEKRGDILLHIHISV